MNIHGTEKIQNDFQNGSFYRYLSINDIKYGGNGELIASLGWDPATGLGSFRKYIHISATTQSSKNSTTFNDTHSKYIETKKVTFDLNGSAKRLLTKKSTGSFAKKLILRS